MFDLNGSRMTVDPLVIQDIISSRFKSFPSKYYSKATALQKSLICNKIFIPVSKTLFLIVITLSLVVIFFWLNINEIKISSDL